MGLEQNGNEAEKEERRGRHIHLVFTRKMEERRLFMEELRSFRKQRTLRFLNDIKTLIGPKWYQTLSVNQLTALDNVEDYIYQDLLEGQPRRTLSVLRILGVMPHPRKSEIMVCVYEGRNDAKAMFVQLYSMMFDLPFDTRQPKYCLNERLILSSIYYIGLKQIIDKLREIFKPDLVEVPPKPKPKPKRQPPVASPYLERIIAVQYQPPVPKRTQPAPLPNLDVINTEPYEEKPTEIEKKEIPQMPPQPPKRKIPTYVCDKLADIINIEPQTTMSNFVPKNYIYNASKKKMKMSRSFIGGDKKKNFGMNSTRPVKKKKPTPPKQNLCNAQYTIQGIFSINNRPFYVLGQVCLMQIDGDLIHGGHARMLDDGKYINIHNGIKGHYPKKLEVPCDCISQYQDSIMRYVQNTKCRCGHYYDFGHEIGSYPADEIQYFEKPSRLGPVTFNYPIVYEMDQKNIQITKDFKSLWETDSVLHDENEDEEEKDGKPKKKKIKKKSSRNCLGDNPRIEDYLKCALRHMEKYNIATRLPDIYKAPELREWMRRRIYGPLTTQQKQLLLNRTGIHWTVLNSLESKGYGHIFSEQKSIFMGMSDWGNQPMLSKEFKKFSREYKRKVYISQAKLNNLWWTTMCQTQFPDKHFREIYFAYLISCYEDLKLFHPYVSKDAKERQQLMSIKRYCCPPDGIENLQS